MFHRALTNAESANVAMMRVCGVSMTQEEFAAHNPARIGELYKLVPHHVMHALGYDVTRVTEHREPVLSDQPVYCRLLDRHLEPGICLGIRIVSKVETSQG